MENVKRTTEVSSNIGRSCEHCDESIGLERFSESTNHYIETHGYRLLHVGTRTTENHQGKLWHVTVAILGHDDPPPVREVKVTFGFDEDEK